MDDRFLIRASGIVKTFGATRALSHADFSLRGGEVHALVGANGAGKSTLSRVICGHIVADAGTLEVDGRPVEFKAVRDAIRSGISIVTQETCLAPDMSVFENIVLPRLSGHGRIDWKALRADVDEVMQLLGGFNLRLDDIVRNINMAQRQFAEILRALVCKSRVIIFDEPTAALSPRETDSLFEIMAGLKKTGHGLIFVSHRMEEIFSHTDTITIIKEGRNVATRVETADITQAELCTLMVGRELSNIYAVGGLREDAAAPGNKDRGTPALTVKGLCSMPLVKDVSFDVYPGEILGLGGLVGAGRSETLEAIFGLRKVSSGTMKLGDEPFVPSSARSSIQSGIGFVPEDRRRQSIVPDFSVMENLTLARRAASSQWMFRSRSIAGKVRDLAGLLGVSEERLADTSLLNFSGGMQQKIIIARWLLNSPSVLLLDEPTRGVDIATRSNIYAQLRKIAAEGVACVVVSSDFEELIGLSDRIVVISDGRDVADLPSADITVPQLAMASAPRSSARRRRQALAHAVDKVGGVAFWVIVDEDRVFCIDSVGDGADIGMKRGEFKDLADTAFPAGLFDATADGSDRLVTSGRFSVVRAASYSASNHEYLGVCYGDAATVSHDAAFLRDIDLMSEELAA